MNEYVQIMFLFLFIYYSDVRQLHIMHETIVMKHRLPCVYLCSYCMCVSVV